MSISYETINAFEKDNIFYLEVNRPDKMNALNKTVLDELLNAIKEIDVSSDSNRCWRKGLYRSGFGPRTRLRRALSAHGLDAGVSGQGRRWERAEPSSGAGTCLIACEQLDRTGYAMECG